MSSLVEFENRFVRPKPGRTLIVGSKVYNDKEDRRKRYADAVGIDMLPGDGVDLVLDLEDVLPAALGVFSHVECMSVLEHSRRPWLMAQNIERLLDTGGTLFVSVPFIWRIHAYPSDYFRFTPEGVKSLFENIEWRHAGLASHELQDDLKAHAIKVDGHPYLSRTETVAFGVKRAA